jgi:hypothetical protein
MVNGDIVVLTGQIGKLKISDTSKRHNKVTHTIGERTENRFGMYFLSPLWTRAFS